MSVGDRVCNLECVEKGSPVHEFVGPVKIILVEPPKKQYCCKIVSASLLSFANVLLSINFIIIYFYTLGFTVNFAMTGHIMVCTLGLQYCMFIGILLANNLFGPAAPVKRAHRRWQHLIIEIVAVGVGVGGGYIVYARTKAGTIYSTVHSIAGLVTLGLALLAILAGPTCYINKGVCGMIARSIHVTFSNLAVIASSACFITGILKPGFKNRLPVIEIYIFMIAMCVIYTIIVIISPCMKIANPMQVNKA